MDITDITRQRSTCSDGSQPLASQKLIEADAASCCLILAKDFAHVWENSQCQWQWCVESSDTWSKLIQRRNCFLSLLDESWKSFWLHKVGGGRADQNWLPMYETSNLPSLLFSPSSLRHFQTKMIKSLFVPKSFQSPGCYHGPCGEQLRPDSCRGRDAYLCSTDVTETWVQTVSGARYSNDLMRKGITWIEHGSENEESQGKMITFAIHWARGDHEHLGCIWVAGESYYDSLAGSFASCWAEAQAIELLSRPSRQGWNWSGTFWNCFHHFSSVFEAFLVCASGVSSPTVATSSPSSHGSEGIGISWYFCGCHEHRIQGLKGMEAFTRT